VDRPSAHGDFARCAPGHFGDTREPGLVVVARHSNLFTVEVVYGKGRSRRVQELSSWEIPASADLWVYQFQVFDIDGDGRSDIVLSWTQQSDSPSVYPTFDIWPGVRLDGGMHGHLLHGQQLRVVEGGFHFEPQGDRWQMHGNTFSRVERAQH
jgi:hypothetical protein